MIEIKSQLCESKRHAERIEQELIDQYKAELNSCKAFGGETRKEYKKNYFQENKEKITTKRKQYLLDNKEKIAKQQKKYTQQYCLDNKEKIAEFRKQYYLDNKEKIAEYYKQYRLKKKQQLEEIKELV